MLNGYTQADKLNQTMLGATLVKIVAFPDEYEFYL